MTEDGWPRLSRTEAEQAFLALLLDGRPWAGRLAPSGRRRHTLGVHFHDFTRSGSIENTWRLDFDGTAGAAGGVLPTSTGTTASEPLTRALTSMSQTA